MLTYLYKRDKKNKKGEKITLNFEENERLHKIYSGHRDPNSFDGRFIEKTMAEAMGVKLEFDFEEASI